MSRARLLDVTLCCVLQVLLVGFSTAQFSKKVGDSCQLASGGSGVCKDFDACDLALLATEPAQPAICTWQDGDAVVCCPTANNEPYVPRQPQPATAGGGSSKASQQCDKYKGIKTSIIHTIVGGEDVDNVSQYPHIALLGYGNPPTWQCGGTLISEQFILTAAHCLNGNDRSAVTTANLGFINKKNRNAFGTLQEFKIIQTFKHPSRKAPKQYADIALLKLDRPVQFSIGVIPACLYEDFAFPVDNAKAIGWGDLTSGAKAGSDILQKVTLSITSYDECSSKYPNNRKLPQGLQTDTQFCAGDYGKDTCQGDSGGPLQIHDTSGMARIIGVTSFGQKCGVQPGVYTRISHYVSWIESIVWPN